SAAGRAGFRRAGAGGCSRGAGAGGCSRGAGAGGCSRGAACRLVGASRFLLLATARGEDRKSTRLNSSHVETSYAVFCLKKQRASKRSSTRPNREGRVSRKLFSSELCHLF